MGSFKVSHGVLFCLPGLAVGCVIFYSNLCPVFLQQLIQDVVKPEKGTTKKQKNVKIFEQKHVFVQSICRLQRFNHLILMHCPTRTSFLSNG